MPDSSKTFGTLTIPLLVLLAICFFAAPAHAKYGGGKGEPNDPYQIRDANHMQAIGADANDWDKCFKLMADIDLAGYTGEEFNIIGYYIGYYPSPWDNKSFTGVFDGSGHTISNFTYTSTDTDDIGLFGYVDDPNAEIKNLGLIDPNVDAGTGGVVGSLVGLLMYGTVTNCYVEGGSVSGRGYVGGLVGGNSLLSTISSCYATGSVSGSSSAWWGYVGGLVGGNIGTITNCYSTGDVSGNYAVGGLAGYNYGTIYNCYSTGSITGTGDVGGLVGWNEEGEITDSFWDIETSGQPTSAGGTGKTTVEMQTLITFIVWACSGGSVWTIDEGNDYPRLWWENMPGKPITNPYGGGTGEPNDPYLVYTAEQLNMIGLIRCHWDKHFKLCADIDLAVFTGTSFNIIGTSPHYPTNGTAFTGVFDGNDHTISNFSYTSKDAHNIGLFGYVGGLIKDLGLIDPNVDAGTGDYVGSLVGTNGDYLWVVGVITNCYVEGGSVTGRNSVGGLVGFNHGTITNCYSTGSVSGSRDVGGLVGYNFWGPITNCYSTASVTGENQVGGLVGRNSGPITNCYSTGSVSGNSRVGGLVGVNGWRIGSGTITNCYSEASVSGEEYVGGLVGYDNSGSYTKSLWDNTVNSGLPGIGNTNDPNVIGESTANMQTQSTFTDAGWDFVGETVNGIEDIWFIPEEDYPHLWWEGMQVPMKLTPRTLNCRSYGNWVKAHLTLPEGFTVEDVDSNRPAVLHSFGFQSAPLYVFVNENERVQIEAAFEREAVCSLAGDWPETLTVAGFLTDGNIFLGTSKVRMITRGMKEIEELALYWLNADCVHPDFCDGIDMNRDSLVNLLDYALLLNSQVEFVSE